MAQARREVSTGLPTEAGKGANCVFRVVAVRGVPTRTALGTFTDEEGARQFAEHRGWRRGSVTVTKIYVFSTLLELEEWLSTKNPLEETLRC